MPGTVTREPKARCSVLVADTTPPPESIAQQCVVEVPSPSDGTPGSHFCARSGSICARRSDAYSFEVSHRTGTSVVAGSAMCTKRSAKAIFIDSARTWIAAAVPKPSAATSRPSRMLRIWMMCVPPDDGGAIETTSCPR